MVETSSYGASMAGARASTRPCDAVGGPSISAAEPLEERPDGARRRRARDVLEHHGLAVRSAAHSAGRAAFLAALTATSPRSGPPPSMTQARRPSAVLRDRGARGPRRRPPMYRSTPVKSRRDRIRRQPVRRHERGDAGPPAPRRSPAAARRPAAAARARRRQPADHRQAVRAAVERQRAARVARPRRQRRGAARSADTAGWPRSRSTPRGHARRAARRGRPRRTPDAVARARARARCPRRTASAPARPARRPDRRSPGARPRARRRWRRCPVPSRRRAPSAVGASEELERPFDQPLGLRPRDQHAGADGRARRPQKSSSPSRCWSGSRARAPARRAREIARAPVGLASARAGLEVEAEAASTPRTPASSHSASCRAVREPGRAPGSPCASRERGRGWSRRRRRSRASPRASGSGPSRAARVDQLVEVALEHRRAAGAA